MFTHYSLTIYRALTQLSKSREYEEQEGCGIHTWRLLIAEMIDNKNMSEVLVKYDTEVWWYNSYHIEI